MQEGVGPCEFSLALCGDQVCAHLLTSTVHIHTFTHTMPQSSYTASGKKEAWLGTDGNIGLLGPQQTSF